MSMILELQHRIIKPPFVPQPQRILLCQRFHCPGGTNTRSSLSSSSLLVVTHRALAPLRPQYTCLLHTQGACQRLPTGPCSWKRRDTSSPGAVLPSLTAGVLPSLTPALMALRVTCHKGFSHGGTAVPSASCPADPTRLHPAPLSAAFQTTLPISYSLLTWFTVVKSTTKPASRTCHHLINHHPHSVWAP